MLFKVRRKMIHPLSKVNTKKSEKNNDQFIKNYLSHKFVYLEEFVASS